MYLNLATIEHESKTMQKINWFFVSTKKLPNSNEIIDLSKKGTILNIQSLGRADSDIEIEELNKLLGNGELYLIDGIYYKLVPNLTNACTLCDLHRTASCSIIAKSRCSYNHYVKK